jgi:hypothetical protein
MSGNSLWHLYRFLQYIKCFIYEFTSYIILLHLLFPQFLEKFQQVKLLHLLTCIPIFP